MFGDFGFTRGKATTKTNHCHNLQHFRLYYPFHVGTTGFFVNRPNCASGLFEASGDLQLVDGLFQVIQ